MRFEREKMYKGCYRIRSNPAGVLFAQIKKQENSNEWELRLKKTETGDLVRLAGLWNTLGEACIEAECLLEHHEIILIQNY